MHFYYKLCCYIVAVAAKNVFFLCYMYKKFVTSYVRVRNNKSILRSRHKRVTNAKGEGQVDKRKKKNKGGWGCAYRHDDLCIITMPIYAIMFFGMIDWKSS